MFMAGNFVGREYFAALQKAGRSPDLVIEVGEISQESVDWEVRRTGGLWIPPAIPPDVERITFSTMADAELWTLVRDSKIDIAIQGGIGILKPDMLAAPAIGFVNVHPGALPAYRGNSCPEWQLYNGDPIVATAHIIDEGIDTGPVITAAAMEIPDGSTYENIRANVYAHCAQVLISALEIIDQWDGCEISEFTRTQALDGAKYWPQIPADKLSELRERLAGNKRT